MLLAFFGRFIFQVLWGVFKSARSVMAMCDSTLTTDSSTVGLRTHRLLPDVLVHPIKDLMFAIPLTRCSERACVLPATRGGLCRQHARMFAGDSAFASQGPRASVETESDEHHKRKRRAAAGRRYRKRGVTVH